MPKTTIFDPKVFDTHIAAIDKAVESKEGEIADHSVKLVHDPDDTQAHEIIAAIEKEIADLKVKRKTFVYACEEAIARNTTTARVEFVAGLAAEQTKVDALGHEMLAEAVGALDHIASLAGCLQKLNDLSVERSLYAYGIFRAARDHAGGVRPRDVWPSYRDSADLRRGPIGTAITAALWRAGLGRVGPSVGVTIEPPVAARSGWNDPKRNLHDLLREGIEYERSRLSSGLAKARADVTKALIPESSK